MVVRIMTPLGAPTQENRRAAQERLESFSEAIIASLTSLIEPMLIVFLGVVVGGIVMAMFLPIFELSSVAGG